MKVLITGSSGFLGSYVTKELDQRHISWKGISRSGTHGLKGDLTRWDLGLDPSALKAEKFDTFLHMGALYDLRARRKDLLLTNVSGTLSALSVARKLGISNFINLSSVAAVINTPNSDVGENESFLRLPFPDAYGESKAFAERIVDQWSTFFHCSLSLRMGVLVGSTTSGEVLRVDGPYHIPEAFRGLKKYIYRSPFPIPLPGAKEMGALLVPVDAAAKGIVMAMEKSPESPGHFTLHMVPQQPVPIEELYKDSLNFYGLGHKTVKLVGRLPFGGASKAAKWFAKMPQEEITYLMEMPRFHTHNARDFLPEDWCPSYSQYKQTFWRGYEKFVQNR